eukprot:scaffold36669_cov49-Cyclotella_meneghiniana.AAC.6
MARSRARCTLESQEELADFSKWSDGYGDLSYSLISGECNSGYGSFVMSEEEMLECISVTSKPMRLRGHLHICSVVECSTRKAKSKGRANSSLIQTPSVANCMHRLVVTMAVGIADCIGWGSPRPPATLLDGHGGN